MPRFAEAAILTSFGNRREHGNLQRSLGAANTSIKARLATFYSVDGESHGGAARVFRIWTSRGIAHARVTCSYKDLGAYMRVIAIAAPQCHADVRHAVEAIDSNGLFVSVSTGEIAKGIALLRDGQRKRAL